MITKFQIGDQVQLKTNEIGIIKSVEMVLGEGSNLYLVTIGDQDLMYSENLLTLLHEKKDTKEVNLIDEQTKKIIKELSLVANPNKKEALLNACKLHKYMIFMEANDMVEDDKFSFKDNSFFQDLIHGKEDYIKNSYVFSHILSQLGMSVYNVGLKDEDNNFYMSNLVLLGDQYHYFDTTLEKEIYKEKIDEDFVLCCAAIGKKIYEKYFTPLCILSFEENGKRGLVPKNVSFEDMDLQEVNEAMGII